MRKSILILAAILVAISASAQEINKSSERNYSHPAEFENFLSVKTLWNETDTLPKPVYKRGTATVVGKIFGLQENANCKIIISPRGVLDGDEKEFETPVNPDGSFQITVPMTQSVSPALILVKGERTVGFVAEILLADGTQESCGVFFDEGFFQYHLQKDFEAGERPNPRKYPTPIVFCGPFSDVNNAQFIGSLKDEMLRRFSDEQGYGYDEAYQKSFVEFIEKQIETINAQPISPRAKEFLALRRSTEITSELVQNCMTMEVSEKKRIWYPRSIYRYLTDEKFFPTKNNRLMLSSELTGYGSYLFHGFRSDCINLKLYGENLNQNADIQDVQCEAENWQNECFGGNKTVFQDAIIAYQYNELLQEKMPFDSASVAFLQTYRKPVVGQIFLALNEENIARSQRKGSQTAVNLPDFSNQIIDKIKEQHPGRFIYLDIWATWCGPCRKAIAEMEPLKPEFKAQNVDFVYLTDESSPLEAWQNQILDIDGDHFRIKKSEMEEIFLQFGFKGWPSYIIISPAGQILYQSADAYIHDMPKILCESIEKFK